jgi:hypothetical protein
MKSVIITGANRGIGLDTALAFGRTGYKVFATMRNPDGAIELKQKIQEEGLPISLLKMDVDSDASVYEAMQSILNNHGVVDVLVNNAGIERHGTIEELDLSEFKSVMETNYFGIIRCVKSKEGDYLFTNFLVRKPFELLRGGQIKWEGDPYNAMLNVQAKYKGLTAPVYTLIQEYLPDQQGQGNLIEQARERTDIDLTMTLTVGYDYFLSKNTDIYALVMNDKFTNKEAGNTLALGLKLKF